MHNAVSVKVALHNQAIFLLLQDGVKPENRYRCFYKPSKL